MIQALVSLREISGLTLNIDLPLPAGPAQTSIHIDLPMGNGGYITFNVCLPSIVSTFLPQQVYYGYTN